MKDLSLNVLTESIWSYWWSILSCCGWTHQHIDAPNRKKKDVLSHNHKDKSDFSETNIFLPRSQSLSFQGSTVLIRKVLLRNIAFSVDTTDQMSALYLIQECAFMVVLYPPQEEVGEYQMSALSSHFCRLKGEAGFIFPISSCHRIVAGHIPTPSPVLTYVFIWQPYITMWAHLFAFVCLLAKWSETADVAFLWKISCKKTKKKPHRFCFLEKATGVWLRLKAEKKVIYYMIKIPRNRKFDDSCFRFLLCHTPNFEFPVCEDSEAGRFCCFSRITAVFSFTPVTCVCAPKQKCDLCM